MTFGDNASLRIAFDGRYIQDHYPGIGRYAYNLIRALAECDTGDELLVLYDPAAANTRFNVTELATLPGVALHPLKDRFHFFWPRRSSVAWAGRPPDIFHAPHCLKPSWLARPSITTVHDLIPLRFPASLPSAARRLLFRAGVWLACRNSQMILTPSEASKRDLLKTFKLPPEKVRVTPSAANESFSPQPKAEVERVMQLYRLPSRYVLHLGGSKPHKNLTQLVDAWTELRGRIAGRRLNGDVKLVLAGREDPRYPAARRRVSSTGTSESVLFAGAIAEQDLSGLFSGATLFVFPSLYEGFGLPALEAMACGAPVVSSSAGALPEVVGSAALCVSPHDVPALADAIEQVLVNESLRRRLAARSLAQAARFSWSRTAKLTRAAYQEAARRIPLNRRRNSV